MFLTSNMSSIHNQTKETWLIFNVVLSIYNNVSKNINFKGYTIMSILYSVGQLKKRVQKCLCHQDKNTNACMGLICYLH